MKKVFLVFLITIATGILLACNPSEDKTAPVIRGNKDWTLTVGDQKPDFLDGVKAIDDVDGEVSVTLDDSAVNMAVAAVYDIIFEAVDSSNNKASVTNKVTVNAKAEEKDTVKPEIKGTHDFELTVGDAKPDWTAGVTVTDNKDTNVKLNVDDSNVNLNVAATYDLVYSATDKAGNKATVTVKVVVKASEVVANVVFGTDPFDGTATTALAGVGVALYYDAKESGSLINFSNITFEVKSPADAEYPADIEDIEKLGGYAIRAYSAGVYEITLKAKDSDGVTAICEVKHSITVSNPSENADKKAAVRNIYPSNITANPDLGRGDTSTNLEHLIVGKDFTLFKRNDTNNYSIGFIPSADFEGGKPLSSFEISFKYTSLNEVYKLIFTMWSGPTSQDESADWFRLETHSNQVALPNDTAGADKGESTVALKAEDGVYIKLVREMLGTTATYKLYTSADGTDYQLVKSTEIKNASTDKGQLGALLRGICLFSIDNDCILENFQVNELSVSDTTKPVISGASDKSFEIGSQEPNWLTGVTVTDNVDDNLTITVDDSAVNMNVVGSFNVVYTATDTAGNEARVTITVTITADVTKPVISGTKDWTVEKGEEKPNWLTGVSATDNIDGALTVTVNDDNVNMGAVGEYKIVYTATDAAGNVETVERKVIVSETVVPDTTAPVISGAPEVINLEVGEEEPDYLSGVTALDDVDGAVDVSVQSSNVNKLLAGEYQVVLVAKDSANNSVTANIKVVVSEPVSRVVFGSDPFNGTSLKGVVGVGTALYFDAKENDTLLSFNNIRFEVVSGTATIGTVPKIGGYYVRPTAAGTVKIKLTAVDSRDLSKVSEVVHEIVVVAGNNKASVRAIYESNISANPDYRANEGTLDTYLIVGKNFTVFDRGGARNNYAANFIPSADFVGGASLGNFTVSFKYTSLNTAWKLLFTCYTGPGEAGENAGDLLRVLTHGDQIGLWNDTAVDGGYNDSGEAKDIPLQTKPVWIKFTREIVGTTVTLRLFTSIDGVTYTNNITTINENALTSNGGLAAKLTGFCMFSIDNDFILEDTSVTGELFTI